MPPRFVYWTILIDNRPTAFRAHDKEDLLPTLTQLRRTNKDVVLKYFARGRVWDSPEQAREHYQSRQVEKRGRDWRPGGTHEDPRTRFERNAKEKREKTRPPRGDQRPWHDKPGSTAKSPARKWSPKPVGSTGNDPARKWSPKPAGRSAKGPARKWSPKPGGRPPRPWQDRPRFKKPKPPEDK